MFFKKYLYIYLPILLIIFVSPTKIFAANVDWPQHQFNAQQIGRTSVQVEPTYTVAWAFADKDHIVKGFNSDLNTRITDGFGSNYVFNTIFSNQVQPIIADGKAFFGDLNGNMYAVNALTGDFIWEFSSNGPILGSAAYSNGVLVFTSMDGKVYGLNPNTGSKIWEYQTGAGISVAPTISGASAYFGSRDGYFYSVNVSTGGLSWKYETKADNNLFNRAPIMASAAVSEDGNTVLFGAENMYFYGVDTLTGTEKWRKKLVGQSFLYGWPVVVGNNVVVRTMSSLEGAEYVAETVLDGLSASVSLSQERTSLLNWLNSNPSQKSMYVLNINTGLEPFVVAMGRVTGNNYTAFPPVLDNSNRLITYFRGRTATFTSDAQWACFGTKYCPDISEISLSDGTRKTINRTDRADFAPELDNGFAMSVGGNYMYFSNHFRGVHSVNLANGTHTRVTTQAAKLDGGDFRGWGFNVVYYGNDSEPSNTWNTGQPDFAYSGTIGYAPVAVAQIGTTPLLFINEGDAGFIVALKKK